MHNVCVFWTKLRRWAYTTYSTEDGAADLSIPLRQVALPLSFSLPSFEVMNYYLSFAAFPFFSCEEGEVVLSLSLVGPANDVDFSLSLFFSHGVRL